ncbi:hypothetical protein HYH03_001454 [Edaphochlamys debaryana]|uniref:Glycosyl transferase CAP10 domain-containing protein n=1 Tax=Edaphochlamys debaryana TaxID=47281 RepID=A0A835YDG9_9CHLO|nr:hypothetical protein HYH03_001454 [Edaphochlamys debaryana]|eukprot:KAG2500688.1 hypothetical protein HYH03_001454 [Edaphochlamys debaryana]
MSLASGVKHLMRTYASHRWDLQVEHAERPAFVSTRFNASDLTDLYDDNLDADLAPWRARAAASPGGRLSTPQLVDWARRVAGQGLRNESTLKLVMIKDGRLGFPLEDDKKGSLCPGYCDRLMEHLLKDLQAWIKEEPEKWPNAVFLLNVLDMSMCAPPARLQGKPEASSKVCSFPVLSLIKQWGSGRKDKDEDILVPLTTGKVDWTVDTFPFEHKVDRAVFRGRPYCHIKYDPWPWLTDNTCSRTYFSLQHQASSEWKDHVDVGILTPDSTRKVVVDAKTRTVRGADFLPLREAARFRYTLNLDGITASSRLAKLLSLNSVVLKQESPWIEWYYRSLSPYGHYVPFWQHSRDDVLHVIDALRAQPEDKLQAIANKGQKFAYHYLRPEARKLYWRQALTEYRKLFGEDMDEYIDKQAVPELPPANGRTARDW